MFSQFKNVVEGLAQPRVPQASPRRSASLEHPSPVKSVAERPLKAKLEERLRASFTVGEVSSPSTPSASTRVSPAPQFVAEHPLSIDHPLSPAAIPLPNSPPPNGVDSDFEPLPLDASLTLPDPLSAVESNPVTGPEPINQYSPSKSLSEDSPITSQVPEPSPAASEEATGVYDTTQSTLTPGISHDQDNEMLNASVVETTHADQPESGEVPLPTEESQFGHSASTDVESLQERLKLMEQRFAGQW
jgi:hypothetical protein